MNEQLKELAEQARLMPLWVCVSETTGSQIFKPIDEQAIEAFAELVRAYALEEAAKICDQLNCNNMNSLHCAAAIRNRSEEAWYEPSALAGNIT